MPKRWLSGQKKRLVRYLMNWDSNIHNILIAYSKKMWGTPRMNTESFRFKNNENLSGRHDSAMWQIVTQQNNTSVDKHRLFIRYIEYFYRNRILPYYTKRQIFMPWFRKIVLWLPRCKRNILISWIFSVLFNIRRLEFL